MCHRMLLLTIGECRMTLRANLGAYVISSGSIAFACAPPRFGEVFLGAQLVGNGGGYLGVDRRECKKTAENQASQCDGMGRRFQKAPTLCIYCSDLGSDRFLGE